MKKTIKEILTKFYGSFIIHTDVSEMVEKDFRNKEINLGCANAWNKTDTEIYNDLYELRKDNIRYSRSLGGRCYTEESFYIVEGETEMRVFWSVDSSD